MKPGSRTGKSTPSTKRCTIRIETHGNLLRELAEGRAPPPPPTRRRFMYEDDDNNNDDNNGKPEEEDFAFHPLLPPTLPRASMSNTDFQPGPTVSSISDQSTLRSDQDVHVPPSLSEVSPPPPSLSRGLRRRRSMDEDEVSLDEDYEEEAAVLARRTTDGRHSLPPHPTEIDMEVQSRDEHPPDVDMEAPSLHDAPPANPPPNNQVVPRMDPYLEFMYFRYGFTYPPQGPEYLSHDDWKGTLSDEALRSTRALFLDKESVMQVLTPVEFHRHLFHFARSLSNGERPPTSQFDLDVLNVTHLLRARSVVTVTVRWTSH